MSTSYNMVNNLLVFHILLLFHFPKAREIDRLKHEKVEKHWSYPTQKRAITNADIKLQYIIH